MDAANAIESDIFNAARRMIDPAERRAYLGRACAGDDGLRSRIEMLLRVHDHEPGFLEPLEPSPPAETIGPYCLKERLGEGGMGVVYRAEQSTPVRREVAIKIVRPSLDSRRVLGRFEAERQALAMMDHPNIARVLDAGASAEIPPRPYFVMEWIHGVPITDYCDDRRLPPRKRLSLFLEVCRAVQHAHQKGVIHRDLKPSNVLVSEVDGVALAKVIDFGIAKAIGRTLTDHPQETVVGTIVGTLEYMSPEQADPSRSDVDTRSDVYSLGVLLYELLTGSTPLPAGRLKATAYLDALRLIREETPPPPSTRLSAEAELPAIAAKRGLEPRQLSGIVRGDLDWIVMKCLEKDRARRYDSAAALDRDLERYLACEPIEARPPSRVYRLRKFATRHTTALAFGMALAAAMIAGTAVSISQAVRASRAEHAAMWERDAAWNAAAAELAAREAADQRLVQLERGHDILGAIFRGLDPGNEQKDGYPLRALLVEKLDAAAAALEGEAVGDPLTVARLQATLGHSMLGLGNPDQAMALFEKAHATFLTHLGPDHRKTLNAATMLAECHRKAGRVDRAIAIFVATLARAEAAWGVEDGEAVTCKFGLARAYMQSKQTGRAVKLYEQVLHQQEKMIGGHHDATWSTMNDLALAYQYLGRHDEALTLIGEVFARNKERWGLDHIRTLSSMTNYAAVCEKTQPEQALSLYEDVLRQQIATLGNDHPDAIQTLNNIAGCHLRAGKPALALPYYEKAVAALERRRFVHQYAGRILENTARCCEKLGKLSQAEDWMRKRIAILRERGETESVELAECLSWLGHYLTRQYKWDDAETTYRDSITIFRRMSRDDWRMFNCISSSGAVYLAQKKYVEAEPLLKEGYHGLKARQAELPPHARHCLDWSVQRLVQLYDAWGKPDEAEKWRRELPHEK